MQRAFPAVRLRRHSVVFRGPRERTNFRGGNVGGSSTSIVAIRISNEDSLRHEDRPVYFVSINDSRAIHSTRDGGNDARFTTSRTAPASSALASRGWRTRPRDSAVCEFTRLQLDNHRSAPFLREYFDIFGIQDICRAPGSSVIRNQQGGRGHLLPL